MKRIKTLTTKNLKETLKKGGCGECQTSCQSACKTSCTVGNQSCVRKLFEKTVIMSNGGLTEGDFGLVLIARYSVTVIE